MGASGSNVSRVAPSNTIAASGGGEAKDDEEDAPEPQGGSWRTPPGSSGPARTGRIGGGTAGARLLRPVLDMITTTDAVPEFSRCTMRFKQERHMLLFMMQHLEEQCRRSISTRCTSIPFVSVMLMVVALFTFPVIALLGVATYRQAGIIAACYTTRAIMGWLLTSARRRWTPSAGLAGMGRAATAFEVVHAALACAACAVYVFDTPVQGNASYARIFPYVAGVTSAILSPLLSQVRIKSPQGVLVPMILWAVQTSFLVVRAVMVEDADMRVKMVLLLLYGTMFTPLLLLKINSDSHRAFSSKFALKIEIAKSRQAALLANTHTRAVKRWAAQVAHDFGTPLQSLQILSEKLSSTWSGGGAGGGAAAATVGHHQQ